LTDPDPYSRFGLVYDDRSHDRVAEAFFRTLVSELGIRKGPGAGKVLEAACGTGLLSARLASWGFRVVGVDRSAVMLRQARERCAPYGCSVQLVQGDMREPGIRGAFDLAAICGDVINHFEDESDLAAAFRCIAGLLREGGVLVFDALQRKCFEVYWQDRAYFYESKNGLAVMRSTWQPDAERGEVEIWSFLKEPGDLYSLRKDKLTEYYHAPGDLERLLLASGFSGAKTRAWSPWRSSSREAFPDRQLWMATR
jgi:SAM-dependent methyltransferase